MSEATSRIAQRSLIRKAQERRAERIRKSAERQRTRREVRRERRRRSVVREHLGELPSYLLADLDSPTIRRRLDDVLTSPRDRSLFGLPPMPKHGPSGLDHLYEPPAGSRTHD